MLNEKYNLDLYKEVIYLILSIDRESTPQPAVDDGNITTSMPNEDHVT